MEAQRPHLELYLRWMEQRAPATIGRRFTTVAGFYRYAVIDGHCQKDPSLAVTRPRVPWQGQRRTVLHPLEYATLLTTARRDGPGSHALVALLGMIGLRVCEAIRVHITDLRTQSGYEPRPHFPEAAGSHRALVYVDALHPCGCGPDHAGPVARVDGAARLGPSW